MGKERKRQEEEEEETAKKNVGVVFKNIFHALNLTSSPKICHGTLIYYRYDVGTQDADTVLPKRKDTGCNPEK
jgi:hypothetical protein